jgi:hypothetical protein
MRGLVFTEFIALVEEKFGLRMADELLSQPGLTDGGAYTSVGNYSHREMLTLVVGLAERTGQTCARCSENGCSRNWPRTSTSR